MALISFQAIFKMAADAARAKTDKKYIPNYSAANLDGELTHIANHFFLVKCNKIMLPVAVWL